MIDRGETKRRKHARAARRGSRLEGTIAGRLVCEKGSNPGSDPAVGHLLDAPRGDPRLVPSVNHCIVSWNASLARMKKQPIEAPPDPFGDAEAAGLITQVTKKGSSRRPGDLCKTCGTYPCPCEEFLEDYDGDVFPAKALSFADGEEWPVFLPSTRDIAAWAQKRKEGVTDLALKQRINGHKKALEAKLREKRKQDKTAKVGVGASNSVSPVAKGSSIPRNVISNLVKF